MYTVEYNDFGLSCIKFALEPFNLLSPPVKPSRQKLFFLLLSLETITINHLKSVNGLHKKLIRPIIYRIARTSRPKWFFIK